MASPQAAAVGPAGRPGRCLSGGGVRKNEPAFWSAPDLWRLGCGGARVHFTPVQVQSGRGLPHSKTLTRPQGRHGVAALWSGPVLQSSPAAIKHQPLTPPE